MQIIIPCNFSSREYLKLAKETCDQGISCRFDKHVFTSTKVCQAFLRICTRAYASISRIKIPRKSARPDLFYKKIVRCHGVEWNSISTSGFRRHEYRGRLSRFSTLRVHNLDFLSFLFSVPSFSFFFSFFFLENLNGAPATVSV